MQLSDYLREKSLTTTEFGRRIGTSHATVSRLATGKRRPGWDLLAKIIKETDGAVTADDFLEILDTNGGPGPDGQGAPQRKAS